MSTWTPILKTGGTGSWKPITSLQSTTQNPVDSFLFSLARKESSGNYKALGPVIKSGMYKGDRALGAYQVMGKNLPSWSKQYLGRTVTPQEFLNNPQLQNQLMRARASELFNKYGNWEDVASIHFTGRPVAKAGNVKDQLGTSNSQYVADVVRGLPGATAQVGKKILGGLTEIGQSSLRAYSALGSLVTGNTLTPSTQFQRDLYGTDKPITLSSVGSELGLNEKGKFAAPVGFALGVSDLIPGGKVTKTTAVSLLKNANKADDAVKILTKMMGVAPEVATKYAPKAAQLTDVKQLSTLVDDVVRESQDVGRIAKKGGQTIAGLLNRQTISQSTRLNQGQKIVAQSGTLPSGRIPQNRTLQELPEAPKSLKNSGSFGQSPQLANQRGIPGQSQVGLKQKVPYNGLYSPKAKESIARIAGQTGDNPKVVTRVVDSVREVKTKALEYFQNEHERVRQLVSRKDVKVTDASNPYLKSTLYSGRTANKIENSKRELETVFKEMKNAKISRKEVSDYLYFRHVPERNLALGEKAAGITTKEAQESLKALESSPKGKQIKELSDKLQKLNNQTLNLLKESGIISNELFETLTTKYKNHVPLNRIFEETDDIGSVLSGKGFDVRSTGIKKAVGSERKVDDILTNILTNFEQAVLRSEKNIVDQATLAFVRDNKEVLGDLFEVIHPKAVGKTFDNKPILETTNDPQILQLFENGKRVWIKIKQPELAIALRGVGREKLGPLFNAVRFFTNLYSGLNTRFNPEFALPNKIRDLQETMVYLSSQKELGVKGAAKTSIRDPLSVKAVTDYLRGADTTGARLYAEMKELGGTTGGFGLSTRKAAEISLEKLEKLANSKTKRLTTNLIKYVDGWNTIFEDSTRLSVYKQALSSGLSKERAAFLAKEASINFNRMGRGGPLINALWMFSNASIQGSTKMIRSLKNPKVAATVATIVGASVAATNEWNDLVDPEWRDKVSKYDRLSGLTVVLPNTEDKFKYITIPVSWGIKPIKVMADYAYDGLAGKGFDAKKALTDTSVAMLEAYNPAGGTDFTSALAPTILDTPIELNRNKSWSGVPIKPNYDPNAPEDIRYFDSLKETKTGQTAISLSEALQGKAGISISPADMKYAYEQYVGGAGRTATKFVNLISSVANEEKLPLDEYPMLSRFYRERTGEEVGAGAGGEVDDIKDLLEIQSRERFHMRNEAEKVYERLKELPKDEANSQALEIKKTDPLLYEKIKDAREDDLLGLTYKEKLIKQLGVENGERAEYIWNELQKLETKEEKNAYAEELRKKKIISDEVFKQLKKLKNAND